MPNDKIKSELTQRRNLSVSWSRATTSEEIDGVIQANYKALQEYYRTSKDHFMLTKPNYFTIEVSEEGGPQNGEEAFGQDVWQRNKDNNLEEVKRQHAEFAAKLSELGAKVTICDVDETAHDGIFRADPSISVNHVNADGEILPRSAHIIGQFSHPGRVTEPEKAKEALVKYNTSQPEGSQGIVKQLPKDAKLEGTGDNVLDPSRGLIISGNGQRNNEEGVRRLQEITGFDAFTIETTDDFFHVDTFISVLPQGHVVYCEDVLKETNSLDTFKQHMFKGNETAEKKYGIKISKNLAHAFFANMVIVGTNDLIVQTPHIDMVRPGMQELYSETDEGKRAFTELQHEFEEVTKQLRDLRYNVHKMDIHLLNLSGGGFHCVSNKVNHPMIVDAGQLTPAQQLRDQYVSGYIPDRTSQNNETLEFLDEQATQIQKITRDFIARKPTYMVNYHATADAAAAALSMGAGASRSTGSDS